MNAEVAFEALRHAYPSGLPAVAHNPGAGWGGVGLPDGAPPDWSAVEFAPLPELTDVIRPGGLANQKAPRLQAALRKIREERGDHSLEFLGDMQAIEARDWLTQIDGIGKKTASIVLLFCFGQPLFPIDRHIERILLRVGLMPPKATLEEAHELFLGVFQPDEMYEAHVNLIQHGRKVCHAQRPDHDACPLRAAVPVLRPEGALARSASRSHEPILAAMLGGGRVYRILLVDDDHNMLALLADQLRADGFEVMTARDGEEALRRLRASWPDLLVIDMMMPRLDGLSLAREIKAQADLPIIVLSAIDAGDSKADLLEEVAEDYVTKPYHYPELRARINRVLRRLGDSVPRRSLVLGPDLTLDLHRREATVGGQTVQLTPTESRLLYALAAKIGQTVPTETLLARGWAETEDADPSYVWVTMRRLRQKVEIDPNRPVHLQTVRGVGYRLVSGDDQRAGRARRDRGRRARPMIDERTERSTTSADGAAVDDEEDASASGRLSFRMRLVLALLLTSIMPLAVFGVIVLFAELILGRQGADAAMGQVVLFAFAVLLAVAIFTSFGLANELTAPLRQVAAAVDRVSKGDLGNPIRVAGDDELARLADSHNRLAADLERRNRELGRILESIDEVSPRDDVDAIVERVGPDAIAAFALIDAVVIMGDPGTIGLEEVVPGVSRPLRAVMRAGGADIGVLIGRLPATRRWEPADQDLFELFASAMAAAIRNAQLFATVESQNRQLLELDAAKDEFLRGVSHNLQTPLTSIRAYAEQLDQSAPDRRLGIIAEQSERLSRMVRQLLTVTRLESGALRPRSEVVSLATRVRKAWEGLGADAVAFEVDDDAPGLAGRRRPRPARPGPLGTPRQRDQVR